jgi:phage shock protein PspC (stress-responsive transcriptional regulator)
MCRPHSSADFQLETELVRSSLQISTTFVHTCYVCTFVLYVFLALCIFFMLLAILAGSSDL